MVTLRQLTGKEGCIKHTWSYHWKLG